MSLTDADFWGAYWGSYQLPDAINLSHSFDRCLARGLQEALRGATGNLLEIGCAPGRWLAYLSKELGFSVEGIEYLQAGAAATRENLRLQNVDDACIECADFFSLEPLPRFDVVMSLGFIEHFNDPLPVVSRHTAWLKPSGLLVLGVPNFRGIHGLVQRMLDASILGKHNLDIMRPEWFRELAGTEGLRLISVGYLGSFEPSLPVAPVGRRLPPAKLLAKALIKVAARIRRGTVWDTWNGPQVSSYILATYRKD